jgi:hypothetical protein
MADDNLGKVVEKKQSPSTNVKDGPNMFLVKKVTSCRIKHF